MGCCSAPAILYRYATRPALASIRLSSALLNPYLLCPAFLPACLHSLPEQQGNHTVATGLPPGFLQDLKWVLRTAYETHGLLVSVSLWSHDILAVRRLNSVANRARAILMMTDDNATAAYVNTALLPMLRSLKEPMWPAGPPYLDAVVAWEVLNEPEGISRYWRLYKVGTSWPGWLTDRYSLYAVSSCSSWHRWDPYDMVCAGSQTYCSALCVAGPSHRALTTFFILT